MKIRLFGLFRPKCRLFFFGKKRTNLKAFFLKRSAITPWSDKADLLGSTAYDDQFFCLKKTKQRPFESFKDDQFHVLRCFITKILDFKCSISLYDKLYQSQEISPIF